MTADDLKQFCSEDESRKPIARPFSQGAWTYATDGRMMIRVARLADVPEYEDSPKDIQKNIFDPQPISERWQAVPADLPPLYTKDKCENCNGEGDCECDCMHVHKCGYCDGTGLVPTKTTVVSIGIHSVSHILLHKIKSLPNIEICESAKDDKHALGIRFDGGEGRLMPMRKD